MVVGASATTELSPPARIDGRYRVLEQLGEGGMGIVYRVIDESTGDHVALKKLMFKRRRSRNRELRFRREYHTMAGLLHPCIVRVLNYGVDASGPYYTMELLEGGDLRDLGTVDIATSCSLLRDVASALAFLHARRLLHRDVGLRNVRRADDGRAKLIDFGVLATAGVSGEVVGTAPYVPPEVILGAPLDHRSDLYALGALAYRMLTSRHAYPAQRFDELRSVWRTPPAQPSAYRPNLPVALDDLVMSLLSRDPLARPASAAEVIDKLDAIAHLQPLPQAEVTRG
ncbi:MAG TPA: serine/threonine-protein kinase, partial [Polyangiaceae bacterium]|nr:serine/threonine-protein kinase [Polyangiaceae bacterium]